MKKRTLSFVLSILMVLSLCFTACSSPEDDGASDSSAVEASDGSDSSSQDSDDSEGAEVSGSNGEEYTLEKEEGFNQLTFYWSYPGVIEDSDVWIWWDGKEGSGYILHPCDYGAKAVVNVPVGIEQVGFIVRYGCSDPGGNSWGTATKDYAEDRFAVITGEDTVIYLKSGDASQYTSEDGGKTLTMIKHFSIAGLVAFDTVQYSVTPKVRLTSLDQVKVYDGEREIPVLALSSLDNEVTIGNVTLGEKLELSKTYEIEIEGYGRKPIVPTAIFDSEEFIADYTYDGDDLGPVINGDSTTFKVWAPTASKVVINLYEAGNGGEAFESVEMVKEDGGVWVHTQKDCGHGTYYTYTVTTSVGTQTATDPYAKSAGVNGDRSMVVDLSLTNPDNWNEEYSAGTDKYTEAVIWEVHVRDFSNKIKDSKYKGKYLAFTETGLKNSEGVSVGVDYLKELGVTHVHLLPVYDYATVDEANPDSGFNWGYDPKNYNVPEGSYSTDPFNGEVRINEFKQMVASLHQAGIGVVMDVVYNHTYDANSSFNRIVPYYYYRYTASGANSSASGCGNDTASERYMFRKFMIDSVSFWAEEYKLDGFRFDLMGLHDLETMDFIEEAVHAINPNALIYGEGWTMGSTIDGSAQANQSNISRIIASEGAAGSVAVFNDAIRDGLKGSVFDKASKGYISGDWVSTASKVKFGIAGGVGNAAGWQVKKASVINYMSAHDNNTLWDKLLLSNPENSDEERVAMNKLGAAILMISQGTPFMQAGEEMLRTKDGDENSYKSGDEINNIDWEVLEEGSLQYETMLYYKGLIEMRKAYSVFQGQGNVNVKFGDLDGGGMTALFDNHMGDYALVLINPTEETVNYELDGEWNLVANEKVAGAEILSTDSGAVTVPSVGVLVYVKS